jgi:hypothetical protein
MDYAKLDAGAAQAVDADPRSDARSFQVFVHLAGPPDAALRDRLVACGVGDAGSGRTILTAILSAREIGELSDEPRVRQIRLSRRLGPLGSA